MTTSERAYIVDYMHKLTQFRNANISTCACTLFHISVGLFMVESIFYQQQLRMKGICVFVYGYLTLKPKAILYGLQGVWKLAKYCDYSQSLLILEV